ncbi:MAG: hypothetical protein JO234_14085 [Hyphomicrobiales bacterium]|nr:hypothetical protein [Hyphomicrobiales bacterium]
MGFLLRTAFWLGLTFHAMSWGDARLSDVVPPGTAQTLASGLVAASADSDAAGVIARTMLRGALQPQPAAADAKPRARLAETNVKAKRPSLDTLSTTDRQAPWRGAPLRGTL